MKSVIGDIPWGGGYVSEELNNPISIEGNQDISK
jgi:hypothetical protein